jgi:hypothetical protein
MYLPGFGTKVMMVSWNKLGSIPSASSRILENWHNFFLKGWGPLGPGALRCGGLLIISSISYSIWIASASVLVLTDCLFQGISPFYSGY